MCTAFAVVMTFVLVTHASEFLIRMKEEKSENARAVCVFLLYAVGIWCVSYVK